MVASRPETFGDYEFDDAIPSLSEVACLINAGGELGISEITVKAHRGTVMRKMKANSLGDLVNMAARLGLAPAPKG